MKVKNVLLGLALLVSTVAFAQEKGDFNGFAGLTYPLESGSDLGITAGVEYVFAEDFSIAPSYTYYFSDPGSNSQFDIDLRYYLGDDSFNWFLTGGVSFLRSEFMGISANTTGFAGGAGALFSLGDSFDLMAVVKYNSELAGGSIVPTLGLSFGL